MEKPEVAAKDKFRAFGEYWRYARFTGYGEALRIAIRDIYGIDEISERTIDRINNAIRERNKPGLYREVLKKRARIRYAVNDEYWQPRPTPWTRSSFCSRASSKRSLSRSLPPAWSV
jgi:hypothetical protein